MTTTVSTSCPVQRITLDRTTVVQINANRPQIALGSQIGPRGPQGPPGLSGGGVIEPIGWSWGDAPGDVYVPAEQGTVVLARLKIDTVFNGVGASISVGTQGDHELLLPSAWIDPYQAIEIENTPDVVLAAGEGIRIYITPGTASQGAGRLFLQFLSNP